MLKPGIFGCTVVVLSGNHVWYLY